ncbi:MAG: XisI protein [Saprospiraceae bacterium]
MDKVKKYQQIIETLLEEYAAQMSQGNDGPESQVVADHKRHHYQLFTVGWEDNRYVQFPVFHFDIREEKVWIQANNTDMLIGQELIERGIPKSDIVLGLQHPLMRKHSGFAVA